MTEATDQLSAELGKLDARDAELAEIDGALAASISSIDARLKRLEPTTPTDPGPDTPTTPDPPDGPELPTGRVGVNLARYNDTRGAIQYDADRGVYTVAPNLVERSRPFSGAHRFMDWGRTNDGVGRRTWSQRATPAGDWTDPPGVPIEGMIAVANATRITPWIPIPHESDNDYARQLGDLIANQLAPDLGVIIEYSNEIFNDTFSQADYCLDRGVAERLSTDKYKARYRWAAARAVELFKQFATTFPRDRVRFVLSGQAENRWVLEKQLEWVAGDVAEWVDAIAIAPYAGQRINRKAKADPGYTVDQGIADFEATIPDVAEQTRHHKQLADEYGVALYGYEGWSHAANDYKTIGDRRVTDLLHAINRDPRIGPLVAAATRAQLDNGTEIAAGYALSYRPNDWGDFGILESLEQQPTTAPKYRALIELIATLHAQG